MAKSTENPMAGIVRSAKLTDDQLHSLQVDIAQNMARSVVQLMDEQVSCTADIVVEMKRWFPEIPDTGTTGPELAVHDVSSTSFYKFVLEQFTQLIELTGKSTTEARKTVVQAMESRLYGGKRWAEMLGSDSEEVLEYRVKHGKSDQVKRKAQKSLDKLRGKYRPNRIELTSEGWEILQRAIDRIDVSVLETVMVQACEYADDKIAAADETVTTGTDGTASVEELVAA